MKIPIDIKSGEISSRVVSQKKITVGIDLGTTNSLIAYIDNDQIAKAIVADEGTTIVPSIVHFKKDGNIIVGKEASKYLISEPERTIYSVKRLLGKSYKDLASRNIELGYDIIDADGDDSLVKIKIDEKFYSPIELSAFILKELKFRAEEVLGFEINAAVITVPAYFNDAQRQATRDAGRLAGLDVLRIVNEPTAASLAYGIGLDREVKKTIAVYDLGGGTFDVSILSIEDGIFEVLSTNGDTFLGGDDIDSSIVSHWIEKYKLKFDHYVLNSIRQELRLIAERAKRELTSLPGFEVKFLGVDLSLTSDELQDLIQPLIDKTIKACTQALIDAQLDVNHIDEVIMVGGSTRIPAVKNAVAKLFNKQVNDKINPDEVVALGAAVQADILSGNRKDILLLDVTPLSLGIETLGGLMDVIIPRNNKIPCKASRQYTTSVDGQKNLAIAVYQGERDLVIHNRKLGSVTLKDIPPMPAGLPKIEITFVLDADGILTVRARELRSETATEIEIKSAYGISEEEMALMLLDSIKHVSEDMAQKVIIEAINEGTALANATDKFISNNAVIFTREEVSHLKLLQTKLREVLTTKDKDIINAAMKDLNDYANPLAHRSMDETIGKAIKGSKIS